MKKAAVVGKTGLMKLFVVAALIVIANVNVVVAAAVEAVVAVAAGRSVAVEFEQMAVAAVVADGLFDCQEQIHLPE